MVRQRTLTPSFGGSNPPSPGKKGFSISGTGTFSFMLEYLSHFMERFVEIPEGISYEEMMLNLLAALHPPTYVHTQNGLRR